MKLNLRDIINVPGGAAEFQFEMDLSDFEFHGICPFSLPVQVAGEVKNSADVLHLQAEAKAELLLQCDRCVKTFTREKTLPISAVLAESISNEEDDNIILLEDGCVDLDKIVYTELILDMDMKILCKPDCKGLCAKCGANLNDGPCGCDTKEIDPRFAMLKKYLDESGD